MRHDDIWRAIDTLAAESGLSPSGLAKRSGLDPTTFNPSKRRTSDGRARWPSTESIAKMLIATGSSLETFSQLTQGDRTVGRTGASTRLIPMIGMAQAGNAGFFDDGGYPAGAGWEEVALPDVSDPHAYALRIIGQSMEPVFREGAMIIVSPSHPPRVEDRVVLRTRAGEVLAKQLARRGPTRVALRSLNPSFPDFDVEIQDVSWLHRIVWASQ